MIFLLHVAAHKTFETKNGKFVVCRIISGSFSHFPVRRPLLQLQLATCQLLGCTCDTESLNSRVRGNSKLGIYLRLERIPLLRIFFTLRYLGRTCKRVFRRSFEFIISFKKRWSFCQWHTVCLLLLLFLKCRLKMLSTRNKHWYKT